MKKYFNPLIALGLALSMGVGALADDTTPSVSDTLSFQQELNDFSLPPVKITKTMISEKTAACTAMKVESQKSACIKERNKMRQAFNAQHRAGLKKIKGLKKKGLKTVAELTTLCSQLTDSAKKQECLEAVDQLETEIAKVLAQKLKDFRKQENVSETKAPTPAPSTPTPPPSNPPSSSDGIPSELLGRWIQRSGSGSSYYDPLTGSYSAPNGDVFSYHFLPNDAYEHSALMQSSLYSCTMTIFGYESGTVKVSKNELTVFPKKATLKSQDTCVANNNYEKPGSKESSHFLWRIEKGDDGSTSLILTWDSGFEEVFVPDTQQ